MFVTWKVLELRARHAELFRDGAYEPIDAGRNICAFARTRDGPVAGRWRNVFTGDAVENDSPRLARIFERFPVAALKRE